MKLVAVGMTLSLLLVGASCKKSNEAGKTSGSGAVVGSGSGSATGSGSAMDGSGSGSGEQMGAGSGSGSDAGSAAGSGSAGSADAGSGSAAAGSVVPLPDVKGEKQGFLLADKVKGTVAFTVGGKTEQIAEGTIVEVVDWPDGVERGDHGEERYVSISGKQGKVLSKHLVMADDIAKAPKGDFALVTPEDSCGDFCHSAVWLVRGMGERWRVFDTAVNATPAWHPQGTNVAIGGDGVLAVIELPSGKTLHKSDKLFAPAYSPDGTLYVRDTDFGVHTFIDGKAKKVGKGKKPKPMEGEDFEPSPEPVTFGPDGKYKLND